MSRNALTSDTRRMLGMLVHATSYAQATEQILDWARVAESRYVSAASVNNVMEAHDSRDFGRIMEQADLITPDGRPLVWGLRGIETEGKPSNLLKTFFRAGGA